MYTLFHKNSHCCFSGRGWIFLFFCQFYVENILVNIRIDYNITVWHFCLWMYLVSGWKLFWSQSVGIKAWYQAEMFILALNTARAVLVSFSVVLPFRERKNKKKRIECNRCYNSHSNVRNYLLVALLFLQEGTWQLLMEFSSQIQLTGMIFSTVRLVTQTTILFARRFHLPLVRSYQFWTSLWLTIIFCL